MQSEEKFWTQRYQEERTGWDIGSPSTPLQEYIDQLENKEVSILIPGAGNAYEAEYLFKQGFQHVFVLDISKEPLQALQKRVPNFPSENLLHADFFKFEGQYDLILEQTFFCSFEPSKKNRKAYAKKISELLIPAGKLAGLWFSHPLDANGNRPFGGSQKEYEEYFNPYFETHTLAPSYNSIQPREGNELFGIFIKK